MPPVGRWTNWGTGLGCGPVPLTPQLSNVLKEKYSYIYQIWSIDKNWYFHKSVIMVKYIKHLLLVISLWKFRGEFWKEVRRSCCWVYGWRVLRWRWQPIASTSNWFSRTAIVFHAWMKRRSFRNIAGKGWYPYSSGTSATANNSSSTWWG